jgi:hypothetical protein
MTILVKKLKQSAVVTLGCGGLLFVGSLGILVNLIPSREPRRTTHVYELGKVTVQPKMWSPWIWKKPECNYLNADTSSDADTEFIVRKHSGDEVTLKKNETINDPLDGMRIRNLSDRPVVYDVTCYP